MNRLDVILNFLNQHSVSDLFDVKIIACAPYSVTASFQARNEVRSQGMSGVVIDFAARASGLSIGNNCFLSECEMSFHKQIPSRFIATAEITSFTHRLASYYCALYESPIETGLFAESQGTLSQLQSRPRLYLAASARSA
jgi:hypothetical protein